jgi:hypothetical protein
MLSKVLSWPPCGEELDVNTPAGLSASRPDIHSSLVESRKCLSGAAMLPKRVGLPSSNPSASARSSSSAYGGPSAGIGGNAPVTAAVTGGTVRKRATAPALSTPRAAWRASAPVRPPRE